MSIQEVLPLLIEILTLLAAVQSQRTTQLQLDLARLELRQHHAKSKRRCRSCRKR